MKALVAGAGIGGLATGIALRQAGWEVELFERSALLREIGAGLMIWPNGARSLQALGVDGIKGHTVTRLTVYTSGGRLMNDYPVRQIAEHFGSEVTFVHRGDLQAALAARFGADGLHLDALVGGFKDSGATVELLLGDGSAVAGDLVVGADGLRSPVRSQLLGDGDPFYLGSTIWRGIVDDDDITFPREAVVNWVGKGAEFIACHLADERIYWAAVTRASPGEKPGPSGHREDVLPHFGGWAEPVPAMIAATDAGAILRNDMYDRPPVRSWSKGRVTLVGDAAHPMTPNAGQGACQALEDAVALGESLHRAADLNEAFGLYESRRLRRANRVVVMSRQGARAVQLDNPLLCAIRDRLASLLARRLFLSTMYAVLAPAP